LGQRLFALKINITKAWTTSSHTIIMSTAMGAGVAVIVW
jgi:hypothetical protein